MAKEIYIFGTCRLCYPQHPCIQFIKSLREYHSRLYTIGNDTNIYTEPVNYTTKLQDVLDSILYMKGELYENLDPHTDDMLQSIFFRGHKTRIDVISPKTHPLGFSTQDIKFDKVIVEAFSINQYIINTKKYGDAFYQKNLPWKIQTGYEHNNIIFDENDIISKKMDKNECFAILDKIRDYTKCELLIIGPYISKMVPDHVNDERVMTQDILKEYCNIHGIEYFDMSNIIRSDNVEIDASHFNDVGIKKISEIMYNFITR